MFNFSLDKKTEASDFDQILKWDFLIVGGGPAGLNAALYAKRKGLVVGVIADEIGGQLHNTSTVDNYLGFNMIEGEALSNTFLDHVQSLNVPILKGVKVQHIKKVDHDFKINVSNGKSYISKTVLLSTGGMPRKLGIPGEEEFANKGVTYCATCDAPFFKDKHVIVAGGGNSAVEGVLDLVPWAKKITLVHRSEFRADQILLDKFKDIDKLTINLQTQILEVIGKNQMTHIKVFDKIKKEERLIEADGLLVEIGTIPNSYLIKDMVKTNDRDEIIVDHNQMTSLDGLYAAGDVTEQPFKQIVISVAEGAKAALAVNQYLNQNYKGE
ncbi:MAG: NAD(P)/FAD-dependent oxidoreductase [Candidatus Izemoplasmatales bacterium]|uniref:FAD-dependent oxidoreductase n=1 Tax=Hujiaoplasma nucleasis TaxID=2725268 RepID=A0A7L6N6H1_9MOLU|nr:FAD-dependent oxidoreductase [Hujiaoplasma nucleasis]QLY40848.1 FAD-dependent oxidoreductase [Hujiaoplasma nucleasis]